MKHLYTPFTNTKHAQIPGYRNMFGKGMGSVLLNTGGTGSASSYTSVGDYERTTGIDIKGASVGYGLGPSAGMGLSREIPKDSTGRMGTSLKSKIRQLMAKPVNEIKRKNINFSL